MDHFVGDLGGIPVAVGRRDRLDHVDVGSSCFLFRLAYERTAKVPLEVPEQGRGDLPHPGRIGRAYRYRQAADQFGVERGDVAADEALQTSTDRVQSRPHRQNEEFDGEVGEPARDRLAEESAEHRVLSRRIAVAVMQNAEKVGGLAADAQICVAACQDLE